MLHGGKGEGIRMEIDEETKQKQKIPARRSNGQIHIPIYLNWYKIKYKLYNSNKQPLLWLYEDTVPHLGHHVRVVTCFAKRPAHHLILINIKRNHKLSAVDERETTICFILRQDREGNLIETLLLHGRL